MRPHRDWMVAINATAGPIFVHTLISKLAFCAIRGLGSIAGQTLWVTLGAICISVRAIGSFDADA
jgi:hypothetical protein